MKREDVSARMRAAQSGAMRDFDVVVDDWVRRARGTTGAGVAVTPPDPAAFGRLEEALEELEVSSEELRIQNEELNAALLIADRERDRYRELFFDAPEAYIVTDVFGVIRQINARGSALLGLAMTRAIGKPLAVFISEEHRHAFRERLEEAALRNLPEWRCDLKSRTGELIPLSVRSTAGTQGTGSSQREVRWAVTDLRPRLEADRQAQKLQFEHARRLAAEASEARARFLADAARQLTGTRDETALTQLIVSLVVPAMGDYCVLDLVRETEIHHAGMLITAELKTHHVDPAEPRHPGASAARNVIRRGEAEVLSAQEIGGTPACSEVVVPIRFGEDILGSLRVGSCNTARNLAADLMFLQAYADRAASALENVRLMDDLIEATRCADEANRTKSEFLATISHELRTPLTAVLGYSELLLSGIPDALPGKAYEFVERIQESARHQRDLVEQILLCARLDAGAEAALAAITDLRHVCEVSLQMHEPLAKRRKIDLIADLPVHPVEVITDEGKIRQVVINLLGNALRFTETGSVRLSLRQLPDVVEVEVADTGVGIPADAHDRIFSRFVQLDQADSRRFGGTGLGLTIVKELVELLGGSIAVDSEVGVGSAFTVRLPRSERTARSA